MANIKTYALFLAFSTSLAASAESRCSFVSAANCLPKVVGSGFTSFEFKPLFPENATFVHAVDTRAKEQVEDEYPSLYSSTDLYVKIGYWVEYGESSLSEDSSHVTDFNALYHNTSKELEGGNNGCDGPFGSTCMEALKKDLKPKVLTVLKHMNGQGVEPVGFLEKALMKVNWSDACPSRLSDAWFPSSGHLESNRESRLPLMSQAEINAAYVVVATESKDKQDILNSGNSSFLWREELLGDLETPYNKVALGMMARAPSDGMGEADDIQLEVFCVKPTPGAQPPTKTGQAAALLHPGYGFMIMSMLLLAAM